ncbi:MAG: diguanylate cyclase [bacterium]|nr:diguanylate cyclase [bacterium]
MAEELKIKVLVVEDNQDHSFLVKRALEKTPEYFSVKIVDNVEKCLELIQKEEFNIIISDYKLPGFSGLQLLSQLKKKNIDLPLVMLTGSGNEEIAVKAMKEGAYDYVIKEPDYFKTIPLVIRRAMDRHKDKKEKEKLEAEIKKKVLELEDVNKKLAILSITDGLTEIFNYRYLSEVLEKECERTKRIEGNISCMIIDIDFFKNINDKFGHQAGDHILQQLSRIFFKNLRRIDTIGRYGGDEFILILPETTSEGAKIVSEKLRKLIENKVFVFEGNSIRATISIGIASFPGGKVLTKEMVIKSADDALYQAKKNGRNRTEVITS